MARQYAVTFAGVAVSVAQDLFELTAAAAGVVRIIGLIMGQETDYGDAAAEGLRLTIVRGHTTTGSGGSTFTALPLNSSDAAAASTCKINNTTVATAGTAVNLHAEAWNIQAGYQIWWPPEARIDVRNAERIVVRTTAPTDAITMSATLIFEEE